MRKKYNPNKLVQRYDAKNIDNLMVAFVGGNGGKSQIVDRTNKRIYTHISRRMEHQFLNQRHHWTVFCGVLLRDHTGSNYLQADELHFMGDVLQTDIQDFLSEYHKEYVGTRNQSHVINIGWIACPYEIELDEEFAFDIFYKLGGYSNLAKWQVE